MRASLRSGPPGVFTMADPGVHDDRNPHVRLRSAATASFSSASRAAVCGDGLVLVGFEGCDDGNDIDDDVCTNACILFTCGDGQLQPGEACDDGKTAGGCRPDCMGPEYTPPRLVAGNSHTCALSGAGTVRCWGDSMEGQLGYGSTQTVGDEPGEMPPPDVELGGPALQIAAGIYHTCALLAGGAVRCWGWWLDTPGEMPPPDVAVGGQVLQIAAAFNYTCALLVSGKVRCWTDVPDAVVTEVPVTGDFVQIHSGFNSICVVRDDGTVACWQYNYIPFEVDFGGFVVEVSGELCARLDGGKIRCNGDNAFGQKGYGHTKYIDDAIQAGDVPVGGAVKRLVLGGVHTCAILDAGNVRCWGFSGVGQLGYGHTTTLGDQPGEMPTPDVAVGGLARELALGTNHTCAMLAGDKVRCWGNGGVLGYGNLDSIGDKPGEMPPGDVPVF